MESKILSPRCWGLK